MHHLANNREKLIKRLIFLGITLFLFFLLGLVKGSFTHKNQARKNSAVGDQINKRLHVPRNTFHLIHTSNVIGSANAAGGYESAASYILVDLSSGEIIADKNSSKTFPVASLTKVMSVVVALDLASPDALLKVAPDATTIPPTVIGVKVGQKLKLEEALEAMLLTSANDAAQVVCDGINAQYGSNVFVAAMNQKAVELGLSHTHFANPQGFDDSQNYSSGQDLAILTQYALSHYPLISKIVRQEYANLPANADHPTFYLNNWNSLVGVYPDTIGLKIGNTDDAKETMIAVSDRGGKKLAAIVLGAPTIYDRDLWTSELLDLGYQKTLDLPPINLTREILAQKYSTWKYW